MRDKLFFVVSCCILIVAATGPVRAENGRRLDGITFMTEQYPPFNFERNGKLQGIAVDLLIGMLQKAGARISRKEIQLLPWARGYQDVLTKKNTCLFSTTRTQEREKLFRWVGPIARNKVALLVRRGKKYHITSATDLKNYTFGVIKDDVGEQLLLEAGVPAASIQRVNTSLQNIKKLLMGRIDFWSYGETVARWQINELGFDRNDFRTAHVLQTKDLYFAFHRQIDPGIISVLQDLLEKMKKNGEYEKIVSAYVQ